MSLRRLRSLLIVASAVPILAAAASAASADQSLAVNRYVALGDSFTAGPLIPNVTGNPIGCVRSDHNYPSLMAETLNPGTFVDASCSGAETDDMTAAQSTPLGTNPPQFDALNADTDLVTVGIGGNDIGYTGILRDCAERSFSDPFGNPCEERFGGELDQRIAEATPKLAAVFAGIKQRAPQARVIAVGYLRLLPETRGCWPIVPVSRGDVPFLDGVEERLNSMIAEQATAAGAEFVDAYRDSDGRDMCASSGNKWVEGIVPTNVAFPVHPNARGMREVANRALASLGAASRSAESAK
jgi:lysophospholipase L1-like esterase